MFWISIEVVVMIRSMPEMTSLKLVLPLPEEGPRRGTPFSGLILLAMVVRLLACWVIDGCDQLVGSECALLDRTGRDGGGEEGHDGGEERREMHLEGLDVRVVC
jgi:hypothetical protein